MPGSAVLGTSIVELASKARDSVRLALDAQLGDRPWRVYVERWRWASGEYGRGAGALVAPAVEITPRPEVVDRRGRALYPGGLTDSGALELRDISITYLEAELTGGTIAPGDAWYYRLADSSADNQAALYFALSTKAPPRKADTPTDWIVVLTPVEPPR